MRTGFKYALLLQIANIHRDFVNTHPRYLNLLSRQAAADLSVPEARSYQGNFCAEPSAKQMMK